MKKFLMTENQMEKAILLEKKLRSEIAVTETVDDCLIDICDDISDLFFDVEQQEIVNGKAYLVQD